MKQFRLSDRRLGLLINFGEIHLTHGIERIVNRLPEEGIRGPVPTLCSFFAAFAPFA